MICEQDMTDQQRELYELMSDISEDCYCAGWMHGLEYAIWGALQDGDRSYGMSEMDAAQLERCRALAKELDGWVIWYDDDNDAELPDLAELGAEVRRYMADARPAPADAGTVRRDPAGPPPGHRGTRYWPPSCRARPRWRRRLRRPA